MTDAALTLELRLVRAELAEVRESQADLVRRLLEREDRTTGRVLLPLVNDLVGERDLDAGTLAAAALNDRTATGQAVREIINDYTDCDGSFRSLAHLLKRLQGVHLGGCKLVPRGEGRGGLRWRVVQVSGE